MTIDRSVDERRFLLEEGGYLALHGKRLLDNGYHVVPIKVGSKAPGFDGWEKSKATAAQLEEWLKHGHKWSGVGVITRNTPAIDIDVRDEEVATKMEAWVRENIGDAPMRIGQPPKRLFLFRTDKPFRKMRSIKFKDEWDDLHQIEVLCEGQQFVAYAKHPDTNKPYAWPDAGCNPLDVRSSELITLTEEKCEELIAHFEEVGKAAGWEVHKKGRQRSQPIDHDNPFLEDTAPVELSDDELSQRLLLVPGADDYETWVNIGMALYHQYDGDEKGLKFWHEWSETADNYDPDALNRRWDDFGIVGKKRAPITARYILKLAKEGVEKTVQELSMKLKDMFLSAKDLSDWDKAKNATREAEIDSLARSALAEVARDRRQAITGSKTSLVEVKKALAYSPTKGIKTPGWAKPWVYDVSDDRFYDTERKILATKQGFDAMYDREAMTKKDVLDGKSAPTSNASSLALVLYRVPTINGRRYTPGNDPLYRENGALYANTYAEHEIPELPEKTIPRDKRNVERVKRHINHLLAEEREARLFLDWLSWVVQHPGKHANYAVLLQGVQGDGKTFFAEMMRAVMGVSNVTMLNAHILHSDFTDWAAGQCVACVEEVRLINEHNKFEVLNRIKPFITNNIVEIHPKGKPIINVKNTTSYLLFTNYKDALPLDDNERRFLILFSRWQNRDAILNFEAENPNYYTELYATIEESPGALRQWLLNHEQSEDFNPLGKAPDTQARQFMVRQAKPAFIQQLDDLIAEDRTVGASHELVNVTELTDILISRSMDLPPPKTLASMLSRDGYESIGKVRIGDSTCVIWSKLPEKFRTVGSGGAWAVDTTRVREFLAERRQRLDDENEL
jgi:hypothetical protein